MTGRCHKDKEDPLIAEMKFVKVPKGTFWMSKDGKNAQVQVQIKGWNLWRRRHFFRGAG